MDLKPNGAVVMKPKGVLAIRERSRENSGKVASVLEMVLDD